MIPDFLKHNFVFDLDLTTTGPVSDAHIYRCSFCKMWVSNLENFSDQVCYKRDRRHSGHKDRRKNGKGN
jgi:hypothetical protein